MPRVYANTVTSVARPPTLLMLLPEANSGWCEQFSEEGYNVIHAVYPPPSDEPLGKIFKDAQAKILELGADWALITYDLRACVHFSPVAEAKKGYLVHDEGGRYIPTVFHLASSQENLSASLLPLTNVENLGYPLPGRAHPPINVYSYPLVTAKPPFPFLAKPPALTKIADEKEYLNDPHLRSAVGLSYTRTIDLLKKYLGPHYDLEKIWDQHTYFEFAERDALKTMTTMVASPYVNHIPTMTGGVGYQDLARFYKYHFCTAHVTPPDTELITVSRTVGADKIVEEMIFKCTHTTAREIDYFLPGVAPTGKPLEIALVGVIAFRGDKLCFEHLYWDQASVLVQLGLLDPSNLPVTGVDAARKVLDPFGLPSNTLMTKWKESEGKSID